MMAFPAEKVQITATMIITSHPHHSEDWVKPMIIIITMLMNITHILKREMKDNTQVNLAKRRISIFSSIENLNIND